MTPKTNGLDQPEEPPSSPSKICFEVSKRESLDEQFEAQQEKRRGPRGLKLANQMQKGCWKGTDSLPLKEVTIVVQ